VYEYFGVNAGWQFGDFEGGFRFGKLGKYQSEITISQI
jgi:hypothetical protein